MNGYYGLRRVSGLISLLSAGSRHRTRASSGGEKTLDGGSGSRQRYAGRGVARCRCQLIWSEKVTATRAAVWLLTK
jgi:hypothetical protein